MTQALERNGESAPVALEMHDAEGDLVPAFLEAVRAAIASGDHDALVALSCDLHESDLGELIEALSPDERPRLVSILGDDFDFAALTEIDDTLREEILEEIPNAQIAEGVRDLESDDAVAILEDLEPEDAREVLDSLPAPERVALERSLEYPEDSAGRLMQSDFIALPPFWSVGQTIDHLRETGELPEEFYELYVVDAKGVIVGRVPLNRLLRAKRPEKLEVLMNEAEHVALAQDDQADVAEMFKRYNLVSIPVVDGSQRLVGVLTFDDIVDVIDEEAEEDMRALGGVTSDEELSDNVWTIAKGRFAWLFINLLTAFLASAVIDVFKGSLEKMVALAVLMPIVASQGGNAGTQTMTVAVRALATRAIVPGQAHRIVWREIFVGLFNGIAFAALMGGVAAWWFSNVQLGLVAAVAMLVNMVAAGLAGVMIPLALDKVGADPALASGPFVTTVTDIVGFFAFLGVATFWFGLG